MSTPEKIIAYLRRNPSASSGELSAHIGISRQALNRHFNRLIDDGKLVRTGSTRNTRYTLAARLPSPKPYRGDFATAGLDEHRVYQRLAFSLNLGRALRPEAADIFQYVFTEIVNNAIDHSASRNVRISAAVGPMAVTAKVGDNGIGIFASIAGKLGLPDEHDALIQLVKGKTTTMPEAHSGEGIFYSSKAADRLVIRSHKIQVEWETRLEDVFVSNCRRVKGTHVQIEVRRDASRKLEDLFSEFAPKQFDYRFSGSKVHVKLLGEKYISRSEARRLTLGLDKFRFVELDFRHVRNIGQGFADEVFRVFTAVNPKTELRPLNASPAVRSMIRHAMNSYE
jgi:DNA-binding Lrp family transcriptional regulator